jgi:CubicO group peptidase (beta-lactamase class C family)
MDRKKGLHLTHGQMIEPSLIKDAFTPRFDSGEEIGAAVCLWTDEGPVVSLAGGRISRDEASPAWTEDTLVPVWSTTKGPAAATLLVALDHEHLSTTTPVHHIWPELGVDVTFAQLLSHQAGLPALDVDTSVFDHQAAVIALERQTPHWSPGTAHGYHPRTFGVLLDECVRRLCGAPLGEVWRRSIAEPLELDVWIGLPESEDSRVAVASPSRPNQRPEEQEFMAAFSDSSSLTRRAFASLRGLNATADLNRPEARRLGQPAFGGLASARGLARFYHALATGGGGVFSEPIRAAAETTLVDGPDLVLRLPTAFSAGFQKDPLGLEGRKRRHHYGPSPRAFGHPGAGGSLAFADPDHRIGFGYVMNLVAPGVMPGERALSLVRALYQTHSKS